MNYLAHIYLSHDQPNLLIGNLSGDFVKGNNWQDYPAHIQPGILLHRAIDAFTDNHPAIKRIISGIRPSAGRYTGPVVDILCDTLLSRNWARYHDKPLNEWSQWVYEVIQLRGHELPENLRERIYMMVEHNWLMGYDGQAELENVLNRFNRRLKEPVHTATVTTHFFGEAYGHYEEQFNDFFPEIIQFTRHFLDQHKADSDL